MWTRCALKTKHPTDTIQTLPIPVSVMSIRKSLSSMIPLKRSNKKVKLARMVSRSHQCRQENHLIFLEGHRLVIDAINFGYSPHQILLSSRAFDAPLGDNLEKCLAGYEALVSLVDHDALEKISPAVTSQGICALVEYNKYEKIYKGFRDELSKRDPLLVICDRIQDPGNLGAIIRNSYALGANCLAVVESCDAWSPKVLRSSMGYGMRFPVITTRWSEIPTVLSGVDISVHLAEAADTGVPSCFNTDFTGATALVIGSEARGISDEARALVGASPVHIPMTGPQSESINAACASAVLLGETLRQRTLAAAREFATV